MKPISKRLFALLIVFSMIIGVGFNLSPAFALTDSPWNGQEVGSLTEAPGVLINKQAEKVEGQDNTFKITLEIQAKEKEVPETADIVLVIDRSGSMGSGGRMTNAKSAAVDFVNKLLPDSDPGNTTTRIALVSFAGDVTTNKSFTGYSGKAGLISAINGLNANEGTHIQAGIRRAISVLSGSSATNKAIVFLGDGGATYSYKPNNPILENWTNNRKRTTTANVNYDYNTRVGNGSSENYNYSGNKYYRHGAHAIAEAGFAPSDQKIYTIALGAGTEGDWTLENMGRTAYYNSPTPASLQAIYDAIASSITKTISNIEVVDPIGDMYIYENDLTTTHPVANYDSTDRKITWSVPNLGKNETAKLTYKVRLDVEAEDFVNYQFYEMNGVTTLDYTDVNGDGADTMLFPIPKAYGVKPVATGTVIIKKEFAGDDNTSVEGIEFTLTGSGSTQFTASTDEEGKATFNDIPVGSYTLEEQKFEGYTNNIDTLGDIIVEKGKTTNKTVINTKIPTPPWKGKIQVTKIVEGEEEVALSGFKFKVVSTHSGAAIFPVTTDNMGIATFNNLAPGTYEIAEIPRAGYEQTLPEENGTITVTIGPEEEGGEDGVWHISFTNQILSEPTIDIPVEKIWHGEPSEYVWVFLLNGKEVVGELMLNEYNEWKDVFKGLPVFDEEGKPIEYDIQELEIPGYSSSVSGDQDSGFTLTNTKLRDVLVRKSWEGGPNPKPAITINLLANGDVVRTVTLSNGETSYEFKDMPEFDNEGESIWYTVSENPVANYTTTYDGLFIMNTYVPPVKPEGSLTIIKRVTTLDGGVYQGAPENFQFEIRDYSGNLVGTRTLTTNSQTETTLNLVPGTYTVSETSIPAGFIVDQQSHTVEVLDDGRTEVVFVNRKDNTPPPEDWEGGIEIIKTVEGASEEDLEQLFTFQLFKVDGGIETLVGTVIINGEGTANFSGLLEGNYILRELPVDGYLSNLGTGFSFYLNSDTEQLLNPIRVVNTKDGVPPYEPPYEPPYVPEEPELPEPEPEPELPPMRPEPKPDPIPEPQAPPALPEIPQLPEVEEEETVEEEVPQAQPEPEVDDTEIVEEEEIKEPVPQAQPIATLPKTGTASPFMASGFGTLLLAAGLFLRKKKG